MLKEVIPKPVSRDSEPKQDYNRGTAYSRNEKSEDFRRDDVDVRSDRRSDFNNGRPDDFRGEKSKDFRSERSNDFTAERPNDFRNERSNDFRSEKSNDFRSEKPNSFRNERFDDSRSERSNDSSSERPSILRKEGFNDGRSAGPNDFRNERPSDSRNEQLFDTRNERQFDSRSERPFDSGRRSSILKNPEPIMNAKSSSLLDINKSNRSLDSNPRSGKPLLGSGSSMFSERRMDHSGDRFSSPNASKAFDQDRSYQNDDNKRMAPPDTRFATGRKSTLLPDPNERKFSPRGSHDGPNAGFERNNSNTYMEQGKPNVNMSPRNETGFGMKSNIGFKSESNTSINKEFGGMGRGRNMDMRNEPDVEMRNKYSMNDGPMPSCLDNNQNRSIDQRNSNSFPIPSRPNLGTRMPNSNMGARMPNSNMGANSNMGPRGVRPNFSQRSPGSHTRPRAPLLSSANPNMTPVTRPRFQFQNPTSTIESRGVRPAIGTRPVIGSRNPNSSSSSRNQRPILSNPASISRAILSNPSPAGSLRDTNTFPRKSDPSPNRSVKSNSTEGPGRGKEDMKLEIETEPAKPLKPSYNPATDPDNKMDAPSDALYCTICRKKDFADKTTYMKHLTDPHHIHMLQLQYERDENLENFKRSGAKLATRNMEKSSTQHTTHGGVANFTRYGKSPYFNCFMLIYYCFSLTKIENISIENSDKFSVLLLSLKNFNITQFIMIPRFSICSILLKGIQQQRTLPGRCTTGSISLLNCEIYQRGRVSTFAYTEHILTIVGLIVRRMS